MLLIDYSQVCISSIMMQTGGKPANLDEGLVRHMILNTLRSFVVKYKGEYGAPIICCDDRKYWRKEIFPHYKTHRKKDREATGLDWGDIFVVLDKIKAELKEFFPYKVIEVPRAEADDIIAVLVFEHAPARKTLIISSDKDFMQLQRNPNVKQYSNIEKKFITTDNPESFLIEHIVRGDRGDGIPNILSPDDVFVSGGRQRPINSKKVEGWIITPPTNPMFGEVYRNYKRNELLIDLRQIPQDVKENILISHDEYKPASKTGMLDYFISRKLTNLIGSLGEF